MKQDIVGFENLRLKVSYPGRFRHQCQRCGRFVSYKNAGITYSPIDGYEVDPYCPTGKGCQKHHGR